MTLVYYSFPERNVLRLVVFPEKRDVWSVVKRTIPTVVYGLLLSSVVLSVRMSVLPLVIQCHHLFVRDVNIAM